MAKAEVDWLADAVADLLRQAPGSGAWAANFSVTREHVAALDESALGDQALVRVSAAATRVDASAAGGGLLMATYSVTVVVQRRQLAADGPESGRDPRAAELNALFSQVLRRIAGRGFTDETGGRQYAVPTIETLADGFVDKVKDISTRALTAHYRGVMTRLD